MFEKIKIQWKRFVQHVYIQYIYLSDYIFNQARIWLRSNTRLYNLKNCEFSYINFHINYPSDESSLKTFLPKNYLPFRPLMIKRVCERSTIEGFARDINHFSEISPRTVILSGRIISRVSTKCNLYRPLEIPDVMK